MYRVAIILKSGEIISGNFKKKEEVDDFILNSDYKRYRIMDIETKEIIETEQGKRGKNEKTI